MSDSPIIKNHAALIWSVADLLRGDYKQSEYGKVIMPLTVIRRLDCVLAPTKDAVLDRHKKMKGRIDNVDPVLCQVAGQQFYNTSQLTFTKLLDDPNQIAANLRAYIAGFSESARDIIEKFGFDTQIEKLAKANLLYQVVGKFAEVDLHPDTVSNLEMGYLYEELIRRFSELSNETAGEHFTPREVIKLMVNLLFIEDNDVLATKGTVRTLFDPACGTGGMLSVAEDYLRHLNPDARLEVFGQELNEETYAICRSDMMLKGQDASHIAVGNSFSEDGHADRTFDYCLANPPFGVEWKKVEKEITKEHEEQGFRGRFGAGLPRINDGSFLFLQHMIAKMKPVDQGGSRIAIVFNGSPLFNGAAGSDESEIRRWIIENDWLEAVVALPDNLFYNTGISTYFWIVTNRKSKERHGKVQLIDAREYFVKMPKSLGEKRKEVSDNQITQITRLYADFTEGEHVKIFPNEAFGYMRITVERPLRVEWRPQELRARIAETPSFEEKHGPLSLDQMSDMFSEFPEVVRTQKEMERLIKSVLLGANNKLVKAIAALLRVPGEFAVVDTKGNPEPNPELRDNENVPLPGGTPTWEPDPATRLANTAHRNNIETYMNAEVRPYVSDAWVDHGVTKLGYEIPITRYFYKYVLPRPLTEINTEIKQLETEIHELLREELTNEHFASLLDTTMSRLPIRRRLRQLAKLGTGHTPDRKKPEYWLDCKIPWVTAADLSSRDDPFEPLLDTEQKVSELGVANSAAVVHPAGTVMLCRTASIGLLCEIGVPMATTQAFVTWTPGPDLDSTFLLFALSSMAQEWKRLAFGSTHETIYMPDLESVRIPYTTLDEQKKIATFLKASATRLGTTSNKLHQQIGLLRQRRDALILTAVTGRSETEQVSA